MSEDRKEYRVTPFEWGLVEFGLGCLGEGCLAAASSVFVLGLVSMTLVWIV